ncbi:MAG: 16S rRNA (cytosine(967)-C(5))-methyltransferase RsmB [Pyrinomonadaceae bacterium]
MNISPARVAAFDILLSIANERAFSSVLLPLKEQELSALDRSLCHELTLGTLRHQLYLDHVIDVLAGGKKIDTEVRIALRLGIYQLYYLDRVPDYSAINETVNLVQRARKTSAKGFANAILRRASRERVDVDKQDDISRLSLTTSHPRWLVEKWVHQFGLADASLLAAENNAKPAAAFRLTGKQSQQALELVQSSRPSKYVSDCYLADGADSSVYELAARCEIYLQDEASQMVARSVQVPDGGSFIDVCAAPGGKTGLIAGRAVVPAMIIAGDVHTARVKLLVHNLDRQNVGHVPIVQYNAESALPFPDGMFDSVLVDAPCTGTGTIRRNPEIRYFLGDGDFASLAAKQLSILQNASKVVKPGGTITYSTCSLESEENEDVCRRFLAGNGDYVSVKPTVPERFITGQGFARTVPHRDGMDGFFIALFRKAAAA